MRIPKQRQQMRHAMHETYSSSAKCAGLRAQSAVEVPDGRREYPQQNCFVRAKSCPDSRVYGLTPAGRHICISHDPNLSMLFRKLTSVVSGHKVMLCVWCSHSTGQDALWSCIALIAMHGATRRL